MAATAHSSRSWRPRGKDGFTPAQKTLTLVCLISLVVVLVAVVIYPIIYPSTNVTHLVHLHVDLGQTAGLPAPPTTEGDLALLLPPSVPVSKERYLSRPLTDDLAQQLAAAYAQKAGLPADSSQREQAARQLRETLLGPDRTDTGDTLLVYVTGQGVSIDGQPYLATGTIQIEAGETLGEYNAKRENIEKLIPMEHLLDAVMHSNAETKVVLLDCGYLVQHPRLGVDPNEFASALLSTINGRKYQDSGLWVITSSSQGEKSRYDSRTRQSLFAQSVHQAVNSVERGDSLTLFELYDDICQYIVARHPTTAKLIGQTPVMLQGGAGLVSKKTLEESRPDNPVFYAFRPRGSEASEPAPPTDSDDSTNDESDASASTTQRRGSLSATESFGELIGRRGFSGRSHLGLSAMPLQLPSGESSASASTQDTTPPDAETPDSDSSTETTSPPVVDTPMAPPGETPASLFQTTETKTVAELVARLVRLRDHLEDREFLQSSWSPIDIAPHHWSWFKDDVVRGNQLLVRWGSDQSLDAQSLDKLPSFARDQVNELRLTESKLILLGKAMAAGQPAAVKPQERHWVDEVARRWNSLKGWTASSTTDWESNQAAESRRLVQDVQDVHYRAKSYHDLYVAYSEITTDIPFRDTLDSFYEEIAKSKWVFVNLSADIAIEELRRTSQSLLSKEDALVSQIQERIVDPLLAGSLGTYWHRQEVLLVLMHSDLFQEAPRPGRPSLSRPALQQAWQRWRGTTEPDFGDSTLALPDVATENNGLALRASKVCQSAVDNRLAEERRFYWRVCRLDGRPDLAPLNRPSAHLQVLADLENAQPVGGVPAVEPDSLLAHWMLICTDYRDARTLDNYWREGDWTVWNRSLPIPKEKSELLVRSEQPVSASWRTPLNGRRAVARRFSVSTRGDGFRTKGVQVKLTGLPSDLFESILVVTHPGRPSQDQRLALPSEGVTLSPFSGNAEVAIEVHALKDREQVGTTAVSGMLEFNPPPGVPDAESTTFRVEFRLPAPEQVVLSARLETSGVAGRTEYDELPLNLRRLAGSHARLPLSAAPNASTGYQFSLTTPSEDIKRVKVSLYPISLEPIARLMPDGPERLDALHTGELLRSGSTSATLLAQRYLERLNTQTPMLAGELELAAGVPGLIRWLDPSAPAPPEGAEGDAAAPPTPPQPVSFDQGLLCVVEDLDPNLESARVWYKWIESPLLSPDQYLNIRRQVRPNGPDQYRVGLREVLRSGTTPIPTSEIPLPIMITASTWQLGRRMELGGQEMASSDEPVVFEIDPQQIMSDALTSGRYVQFAVDQWQRAFIFDVDRAAESSSVLTQFSVVRLEVIPHKNEADPEAPPVEARFLSDDLNHIGFREPGFDLVIRASVPPEDERSRNLFLKVREGDRDIVEGDGDIVSARQVRSSNLKLVVSETSPASLLIVSQVEDYVRKFTFPNKQQVFQAELDIPDAAVQPAPHELTVTIDAEPAKVQAFHFVDRAGNGLRTLAINQGDEIQIQLAVVDRLSGISSDAVVGVFAVQGANEIGLGRATPATDDPSLYTLKASTKDLQVTTVDPYRIKAVVEDRLGNTKPIEDYLNPNITNTGRRPRPLELTVKAASDPAGGDNPPPAAMKTHTIEVAVTVKDFRPYQNKDVKGVKVLLFAGDDDEQGRAMKLLGPVDPNDTRRTYRLADVPEGTIRIEAVAQVQRISKTVTYVGDGTFEVPKDFSGQGPPPLVTADEILPDDP